MTPKLVNFDLPTTGQFSAAVDIEQAIRDSDANVEAGSASRSFPMTADRRSSISRLSTWTIRSEDLTGSATHKLAA
jgi:hypothetical protein